MTLYKDGKYSHVTEQRAEKQAHAQMDTRSSTRVTMHSSGAEEVFLVNDAGIIDYPNGK